MRLAGVIRFLRLRRQRRLLFFEAYMCLIWARLLLRFLSFRRLISFFSTPLRKTAPASVVREELREDVCWAIERGARALPGETVCFPRAIAAQLMCRRRGIDTTMYYGASVDPVAGLIAHVWVQDGTHGVVGHFDSYRYSVLACFPDMDMSNHCLEK